jgi:zinc-ribbon domain
MVFCGQCGYQLSPGDKVCPRCGSATDVEVIEQDPGTYNPTEISHAVLERPQASSPQNRGNQPEQAGPLVLGPVGSNMPGSDDATAMMNSQMYMPQPGYPGYPPQAGTGLYGYNAGGYPQYQAVQTPAAVQLMEASRKGKVASLLLILFGLLLMVGAIIVFLLTQQGIIFTA